MEATSTAGDIALAVTDAASPGQSVVMAGGASVTALQGSVSLLVGDNFSMAAGSAVDAAITAVIDERAAGARCLGSRRATVGSAMPRPRRPQ